MLSLTDRDALEPTSNTTPTQDTYDVTAAQTAPASASATVDAATESPHAQSTTQATERGDEELDPDILDILGTDPAAIQKYGPDINKDLAHRLCHIATTGLDKETRKTLIEKYLVPANCSQVGAPQLNAEIKAAVPDTVLKRDKAMEVRQNEIATAISCLSQTISTLLKDKDKYHELLKQLMDTARILCDIQYSESVSRKNFALYSLKKDMKEQLSSAKIDNFLFGEDLAGTLRTAKAVTKSSCDLKIDAPKKKPVNPNMSRHLNWKSGPGNRRAAPGPSRRPLPPPPPPSADSSRQRPVSSSRTSSHRNKQTRRR
ncbi:unnamed protein product [Diatraea saccharalis]|uniref:Uncharacterized protein n=1 Tax=Diatraea saccharalis TaxID=40085 RepID=A0A9N9RFK7_9NEOP|nr:unnamed protein product [Diatraea saccharalis]